MLTTEILMDKFEDKNEPYVNLNIALPADVTDDYQLVRAYKCEDNRNGVATPIVRCLFKKVDILNKG